MSKKYKRLYEITYSDDVPEVSLEKDPISPEEIPESINNYDSYDEAIELAQKMAKRFGGDIDAYVQNEHQEIISMYDDNMSPGEKLIQYIVDGGLN